MSDENWCLEWKDEAGPHLLLAKHLEIRTPIRTRYGSLVTWGVIEKCPTESKVLVKAIGMPTKW